MKVGIYVHGGDPTQVIRRIRVPVGGYLTIYLNINVYKVIVYYV